MKLKNEMRFAPVLISPLADTSSRGMGSMFTRIPGSITTTMPAPTLEASAGGITTLLLTLSAVKCRTWQRLMRSPLSRAPFAKM